MNAYDVIKKPVTSEKSYEGIRMKKYGFLVDVNATKTDIKAAVEEIFKVKVAKVNTVNVRVNLRDRVERKAIRQLPKRLTFSSKPTVRLSSSSRA